MQETSLYPPAFANFAFQMRTTLPTLCSFPCRCTTETNNEKLNKLHNFNVTYYLFVLCSHFIFKQNI